MAKKNKENTEETIEILEIPDGKIADFITGKWVKETELEQVRQNFERTLVEEYEYPASDIRVDFPIKIWDGDKQKWRVPPERLKNLKKLLSE